MLLLSSSFVDQRVEETSTASFSAYLPQADSTRAFDSLPPFPFSSISRPSSSSSFSSDFFFISSIILLIGRLFDFYCQSRSPEINGQLFGFEEQRSRGNFIYDDSDFIAKETWKRRTLFRSEGISLLERKGRERERAMGGKEAVLGGGKFYCVAQHCHVGKSITAAALPVVIFPFWTPETPVRACLFRFHIDVESRCHTAFLPSSNNILLRTIKYDGYCTSHGVMNPVASIS